MKKYPDIWHRKPVINFRNIQMRISVLVITLILACAEIAYGDTYEDVLEEMRIMRSRINTLEEIVVHQQCGIKELKGALNQSNSSQVHTESFESEAAHEDEVNVSVQDVSPDDEPTTCRDTLETRLKEFKEELISGVFGEKSPLDITGFFDFTIQSQNERDDPFDFGAFEMDIEYSYGEHYAFSTALVWDDNETPELAVGVIDYHLFDDDAPVRGRIFDEPGIHVQAGRFDLPFGVDYQYFASVDRPTVSAPLTTERIQLGGFNSDGARLYGTWKLFDYTLYAVDSLYGDNGGTIGGRLAFFPSRNPYRLHRFGSNRSIEVGVSYLRDMDNDFHKHDQVYGCDFTLNYGMFMVVTEWMQRDSEETIFSGTGINPEEQDESGFHATMVAEMEDIVKHPVYLFGRYDAWYPDYDFSLDIDDDTIMYRVRDVTRLTFGIGYRLTEMLNLKLEYFDHQGNGTKEPGFDDSGVIFQLTAGF